MKELDKYLSEITDQEVMDAIKEIPPHYSANLVVDIGSTCDFQPSIAVGSGSNLVIGGIVDLLHADTYCNIYVAGAAGSGIIEVRVQTSDSLTSGSFTDPTSGFTQLPTSFVSGGVFFANSGLWSSGNQSLSAPVDSAPLFCSGGIQFAAFQKPQRYARLVANSGPFPNFFSAGFVSQKRTTGSGGGFTFSPGSGTVSV